MIEHTCWERKQQK